MNDSFNRQLWKKSVTIYYNTAKRKVWIKHVKLLWNILSPHKPQKVVIFVVTQCAFVIGYNLFSFINALNIILIFFIENRTLRKELTVSA